MGDESLLENGWEGNGGKVIAGVNSKTLGWA